MPTDMTVAPVSLIAGELDAPERGIGLCLSGGGYRAVLFHAGVLWRLNEAGLLPLIARISSVSGGSIAAAYLGMRWAQLAYGPNRPAAPDFRGQIVRPLQVMASRSIDVGSVLASWLPGITVSERIATAYDNALFEGKTLQSLPADNAGPRFVINAANMQTGALWRFSRPYMADYRVGRWLNPEVKLSLAVAASSAFPPVLSPCFLSPNGAPDESYELGQPPFTTDVELSDGGVYDNLGLETVYKRYTTVLVSDAGRDFDVQADPADDYLRHTRRVIDLMQNQVLALRRRLLIAAYRRGDRGGAYWGLTSEIPEASAFGLLGSAEWQPYIDRIPTFETRLRAIEPPMQRALINWGYVVASFALDRWAASHLRDIHGAELTKPIGLPFSRPLGVDT